MLGRREWRGRGIDAEEDDFTCFDRGLVLKAFVAGRSLRQDHPPPSTSGRNRTFRVVFLDYSIPFLPVSTMFASASNKYCHKSFRFGLFKSAEQAAANKHHLTHSHNKAEICQDPHP